MQADPEELRRHYASLPDEALWEIDRSDLTGVAQQCYDAEVEQRDLAPPELEDVVESGPEPEWLPDAACACSFTAFPGSTAAEDASNARGAIEAAGIPCYISTRVLEPDRPDYAPARRHEYQVMVPGALNLQATSVLDRDIFNHDVEAEWAAHFQGLSDDELQALTPEVICAGLEDRIMRLKRAYAAEMVRRGLAEEPDAE